MGRIILTIGAASAILATAWAQGTTTYIPYAEARPILESLRSDLIPEELRSKTSAERAALWTAWASKRDADIRRRLEQGDADSIVNFLLFGISFTRQPRVTEAQLDSRLAGVRVIVDARIADLSNAVSGTGAGERVAFVREHLMQRGVDVHASGARDSISTYLAAQVARFVDEREAVAARAVTAVREAATNPSVTATEAGSLFSDRGLSSDTTVFVDFGLEAALDAIKNNQLLPSTIRRVGIVGPGLDFTDKREGYDFYPPQTLQPFAIMDSLIRLKVASATTLQVRTFDLSPRVNQHIATAAMRGRAGNGYVLQVPRDTTVTWNPLLITYWQRLGDQIGTRATPAPAPPGVQVRAVRVRPSIAAAVTPVDINVVLQRPAAIPPAERYDLIVATNILVYYGVFEQSLALANIAAMLKPGGLLLTNSPVFDLPAIPMRSAGYTDVVYEQGSAARDRVFWYLRQ